MIFCSSFLYATAQMFSCFAFFHPISLCWDTQVLQPFLPMMLALACYTRSSSFFFIILFLSFYPVVLIQQHTTASRRSHNIRQKKKVKKGKQEKTTHITGGEICFCSHSIRIRFPPLPCLGWCLAAVWTWTVLSDIKENMNFIIATAIINISIHFSCSSCSTLVSCFVFLSISSSLTVELNALSCCMIEQYCINLSKNLLGAMRGCGLRWWENEISSH